MHFIIYLPPYNDINKWQTCTGVITDYGIRYTTDNRPYILYNYRNKIYLITYHLKDLATYWEIWDPFFNLNMVKIKDRQPFIEALNTNNILINTKIPYPIWEIMDRFTHPDVLERTYKNRENKMSYMLTYIQDTLVKRKNLGNYQENNTLTEVIRNIPSKAKKLDTRKRFITQDIETYTNKDNYQVPYLIGYYRGETPYNREKLKTFYLLDYKDKETLIETCINSIAKKKNNNCVVYAHNMSNFDIMFIINALNKLGNITKQVLRHNTILRLEWRSHNNINLIFKDSFLQLRNSLNDQATSFNVPTKKGHFPHKFSSYENQSYKGIQPDENKFYSKVPNYITLKNFYRDKWDFKIESIKYIEKDLKSLWLVISVFKDYIFEQEHVHLHDVDTLSALAFKIYRTNYLNTNTIIKTYGELDQDIRLSYFGGEVNVYKPRGNNIFCYDVNSLYPYAMLKPMPIGYPKIVRGDIKLNKSFGFYYASIKTPLNLEIPVLPYKDNIKEKILFPQGEWKGWYFSEELKEAKKNYNYKITQHHGYEFEKNPTLFHDYVHRYYALKSSKDMALKTVAKSLLNNLYGRFGMRHEIFESKIQDRKELFLLLPNIQLERMDNLAHNKVLIKYMLNDKTEDTYISNINIALAAAISSYARIHMNKFRHIRDNQCLYTDTDSVFLEKPLPKLQVGNEIGQMKEVYPYPMDGVFIQPKLYGLSISNKLLNTQDEELKAKGIKDAMNLLNYEDYQNQLIKDNSQRIDQRLLKKETLGDNQREIELEHELSIKSTKREYIYDNNIFIDTKPFRINM